jgi:hypothetical protein
VSGRKVTPGEGRQSVTEPVRYARTLAEAHLYISLTLAEEGAGDDAGRDGRSETALTEGPDAWTVRRDGSAGGPSIEVLVRYETEAEAQRDGLRFGTGVSTLVDAGQWLQIAAVYARRARRESLFFAEDPADDERYLGIVEGWALARDATIEAVKFLHDDADELSADAFWTEMGRSAREESPERFTQDRLESDIAFCEQSLEDFRRLHGVR